MLARFTATQCADERADIATWGDGQPNFLVERLVEILSTLAGIRPNLFLTNHD